MKAAVLYNPGEWDSFILEEREIPVPDPGWVLVKVQAFGLNRSELMTRKGFSPNVKFPRVLGIECVGEVVEDPSGRLQAGQKVAAIMGGMGRDFDGSYTEFAVLPDSLLYPFDSILKWEQLGAIPEMFQTVYGSLHLGLQIKAGETLLVRGGTSSIGMLAIQIAKEQGLVVLATTRSSGKKQLLLNNGADYVLIDDGQLAPNVTAIFPEGVNKILELVGAATLKDSLKCAALFGTVCMSGMLSEQWSIPEFSPMEFIPATIRLTSYDSGQISVDIKSLQQFIRDVEAGKFLLNINQTFKLQEISLAHQVMESNAGAGKIVILNN